MEDHKLLLSKDSYSKLDFRCYSSKSKLYIPKVTEIADKVQIECKKGELLIFRIASFSLYD